MSWLWENATQLRSQLPTAVRVVSYVASYSTIAPLPDASEDVIVSMEMDTELDERIETLCAHYGIHPDESVEGVAQLGGGVAKALLLRLAKLLLEELLQEQ